MYRATDSSNNFMNFQVNIHVTDDTPPEIFTNRYFINIDGALNYTLDEIIQHLVDTGQISAETQQIMTYLLLTITKRQVNMK